MINKEKISGSSVIQSIAYCTKHGDLCIEMQSGKTYVYFDIDYDLVSNFRKSSSYGSFYNRNIKGKYSQKEITNIYDFIESHESCNQITKLTNKPNSIQFGKYLAQNFDNDEINIIDNKEDIVDYISQHPNTKFIIYELAKVIKVIIDFSK